MHSSHIKKQQSDMCTIYTYAIPGKPLRMSAIIFTMEPPLSDIHNLYTKQEGQKKGML